MNFPDCVLVHLRCNCLQLPVTTARSAGLHSRVSWAEWMCAAQLCTFTVQGVGMDSHTLGSEFIHCGVQGSGAGEK